MIKNEILFKKKYKKNWKITFVDTGSETGTAERLKIIQNYLINDKSFFLTYSDGVSNINLKKLLKTHKKTITALR